MFSHIYLKETFNLFLKYADFWALQTLHLTTTRSHSYFYFHYSFSSTHISNNIQARQWRWLQK